MIQFNPNLSIIIKLILLINTINGSNIDGNSIRQSETLPIRRTKRLIIKYGDDAELNDYPWMAMLVYQQLFYVNGIWTTGNTEPYVGCAGSLLNPRYILTVAHCIEDAKMLNMKLIAVRLGEYDSRTEPDCGTINGRFVCHGVVEIAVDKTILHENYSLTRNMIRHDIALLRLARTVSYNDYIRPIQLPNTSYVPPRLWISGWGMDETGQSTAVKQKLEVPLSDWYKCQTKYANISMSLQDAQICAGGLNNANSCMGDSGGPLMAGRSINQSLEVWTIYGIIAQIKKPCGGIGWPSIYTRVYTHVPWIMEKIEKYDPDLISRP